MGHSLVFGYLIALPSQPQQPTTGEIDAVKFQLEDNIMYALGSRMVEQKG
jgi:hypothetical protein